MVAMRLAAVLLLLTAAVGCSLGARPNELPGDYALVADNGSIRLTLRPDHSYEQIVTYRNGQQARASGAWEYSTKNSDITFPNLYAVRGHNIIGISVSSLEVTKAFGSVRLEADPNEGTVYKKL